MTSLSFSMYRWPDKRKDTLSGITGPLNCISGTACCERGRTAAKAFRASRAEAPVAGIFGSIGTADADRGRGGLRSTDDFWFKVASTEEGRSALFHSFTRHPVGCFATLPLRLQIPLT